MASAAPHIGRLVPSETTLFVCDVQERFRPIISGFPAVIDTSKRMVRRRRCGASFSPAPHQQPYPSTLALLQLRAAAALELPVVVTEQYPKALGSTVAELQEVMPAGALGTAVALRPGRAGGAPPVGWMSSSRGRTP